MGLVSDMVALADTLTQDFDLQADVTHQAAVSPPDGAGKVDLAAAVTLKAIVEQKLKSVRVVNGEMVVSQASVTLLRPTTITLDDKFVLPDGTTGPILATAGFIDGSNAAILKEIFLGF